MAKQLVSDSRTVILGRGRESSSILQQMVNKSIQIKNEIAAQSTAKQVPAQNQKPVRNTSKD